MSTRADSRSVDQARGSGKSWASLLVVRVHTRSSVRDPRHGWASYASGRALQASGVALRGEKGQLPSHLQLGAARVVHCERVVRLRHQQQPQLFRAQPPTSLFSPAARERPMSPPPGAGRFRKSALAP